MLEGPSIELYKKIISQFPDLYFVASGGVSNIKDVIELQNINCNGVIIGKAIYENKITIDELKDFIKNAY
jgi:phosphoribosylformimino-5-aminoimidazole carboxamide ribotide isomerase